MAEEQIDQIDRADDDGDDVEAHQLDQVEQAAQALTDSWNEITDEAGREAQLEAYRATIGAE